MAKTDYTDNTMGEVKQLKVEINGQQNSGINFSNYVDEVFTTNYINNVITTLNSALSGIKNIFDSALLYFQNVEDISNTTQPEILKFDFEEIETLAVPDIPLIGIASGVVNTNSDDLMLRSEATTKSNILNRLPKGSTIVILEEDNGNGWLKVKDENGNIGYVSSKYIKQNDNPTEQIQNSLPNHNVNLSASSDTHAITTGKVKLTSGRLNVRNEPNGKILGTLDNNTKVSIIEYNKNGWSKIKLNDGAEEIEAYVFSKYLEV